VSGVNIDAIRATVLDARTKGIPGTCAPFALSDIAAQGWNVLRQDMPLPLMVLKRANLDYNADLFATYLKNHNLSLAPHGKTTMAPQIFAQQLDDGAWGITAATVNQVQLMLHYGVRRIVLANQLVGRAHLAAIAAAINADAAFEFYCFVDSLAQLRNMESNLEGLTLARPIRLLVEIGAMGGRTGVRDPDEALALVQAIIEGPKHFRFHGLATFEGALAGLDQSSAPVAELAARILDIARALPSQTYADLDEFILTGGGSAYFDMIADRFSTLNLPIPVRVLLRSGCYVTNDHGAYRDAQEQARLDPDRHWSQQFRPALEVWSYVQSTPEPGLAFLTMGKRDVPYDAGLPVPFKRYRPGFGFLPVGACEIFATNDQHAFVRLGEDADWQVGDMVASGISHPCTAFDKWRFIPVVTDDYDVVDGVLTFF
jgi:D-serine deaminase-like pyridoxal phosphate-dependent protein